MDNDPNDALVIASSELPPILAGHDSPAVQRKAREFYASVAEMFEAWVARSANRNTQRAYRADVMSLAEFLEIEWPREAGHLLPTTIADVRDWRTHLDEECHVAPKTLNRRLSSVSSFFEFMRGAASDARLPILIQNPAQRDFIGRPAVDPVTETKALTPGLARKLMNMPSGDSPLELRDRAILKFYLFTGARIGTGCRLRVEDFHWDEHDSQVRVQEKGRGRAKRAIGIHSEAAEAIHEYVQRAGLKAGPLFRARRGHGQELEARGISVTAMYLLLTSYLKRLSRAMVTAELEDGTRIQRCVYSPHSLRATTATLLLAQGVDIVDVQTLLGHKHVTTTQIYDKRVRQTRDSASHKISF